MCMLHNFNDIGYSLDTFPIKGHVLKAQLPAVALLGGGGIFKKGDLVGGFPLTGGVFLMRLLGPLPLPVFLFYFLAAMMRTLNPLHISCITIGPKQHALLTTD